MGAPPLSLSRLEGPSRGRSCRPVRAARCCSEGAPWWRVHMHAFWPREAGRCLTAPSGGWSTRQLQRESLRPPEAGGGGPLR
eukprot:7290530-Pyramimonas_sp.AAC.1